MPDATPPPRYESTVSPPSRPGYATPGSTGAGTLGVRDQTGLEEAFVGGVGITGEAQQAALTTARATLDRPEDDGQNPMFPQYRRNFVPAGGTLTEEYIAPRDKSSVATGTGTGLGTAYTPTIASPGEVNGINPRSLVSVASHATQVLTAGPDALDNPSNEAHNNTDATTHTNNVGTVRRFKLGVGSGAGLGTEIATTRGQFPRPPT